jgi:hypothetical protein
MSLDIKKYEKPGQSGIVSGEPNDVYHAAEACLSASKLKAYAARPLLYKKRYVTGEIADERKEYFDFGNLAHCMVLEGDDYLKRYAIAPEPPLEYERNKDGSPKKTSAEYKAWAAQVLEPWAKIHEGKTFATQTDDRIARNMRDSVAAHPIAGELLKPGTFIPELVFRSEPLKLGFRIQCRTDAVSFAGCSLTGNQPYIADLKTIASIEDVERHIASFAYYRQAAFYLRTIEAVTGIDAGFQFFFVFAEKQEPFEVMVVEIDRHALQVGLNETTRDMLELSDSLKTGLWKSYVEKYRENGYSNCYRCVLRSSSTINGLVVADLPEWFYLKQV